MKKGYWYYLFVKMPRNIYINITEFWIHPFVEYLIGILLFSLSLMIISTNYIIGYIDPYAGQLFKIGSWFTLIFGFLLLTHGYYRSK